LLAEANRPLLALGGSNAEGSMPFIILKPMGPRPKALNSEDYPKVQFWTLVSWRQLLADKKGVTNSENVGNHYLENDDGQPLDKSQIEKIHAEAYSLWHFVRDAHHLPLTWGVAAADVSDFYRVEMVRRCPELLLCEDDWKANYLATQLFSTFNRTHGAGKKIKKEAKEVILGREIETGGSKRKIKDPPVIFTNKKLRTSSAVVAKQKAGGNDGILKASR